MKRIVLLIIAALLGCSLALCAIAEETTAPNLLPLEGDFSDAARAWAGGLADTDWQALFEQASAQVGAEAAPSSGFLASEVPLDSVTGPLFLVDEAGEMAESDAPLSDVFTAFFARPERWEALAAEGAPPVFMVAQRREDRVVGTYTGGATFSVSVYRLYVIDGEGTLLGWDEVLSQDYAPYVLNPGDPRFYDENPFPDYLDGMRYAREMMLVEDGVLTAYWADAPSELMLPEGITAIAGHVFENQPTLRSLALPASLEIIGECAFFGCENLASVVFGGALVEIGPHAFENCGQLRAAALPDSLLRIGEEAFRYCTALSSLALPDSLLSIGRSAFEHCHALSDIDFGPGTCRIDSGAFASTPWLDAQAGDYVIAGDSLVDYRGAAEAFAVPEGVLHVSVRMEGAALTSLVLPEGVQSVGSYAFTSCESLADITFPESLTHVGSGAFRYTAWLDALTEPTVVGGGVLFAPFGYFEPYEIPEGVTCISDLSSGTLLSPTVIPASCVCIEATGFMMSEAGDWALHIPASVAAIDTRAFDDVDVFVEPEMLGGAEMTGTVYCAPGSAAERWARARTRALAVVYAP